MLVLSRKVGERVELVNQDTGEPIGTVEVLPAAGRNRMRLGFRLSQSIGIHRPEMRLGNFPRSLADLAETVHPAA